MKGVIDKTTFGDEDGDLVKVIDRDYGRNMAFDTIRSAFNLGKNYLSGVGITASVEDFDLDEDTINESDKIVKTSEKKAKEIIESYENKTLELIPGKTEEESREIHLLKVLNEVRTKIGAMVKERFSDKNPISNMIDHSFFIFFS